MFVGFVSNSPVERSSPVINPLLCPHKDIIQDTEKSCTYPARSGDFKPQKSFSMPIAPEETMPEYISITGLLNNGEQSLLTASSYSVGQIYRSLFFLHRQR
jgi:hypothetical protein